MKVLDFGLVKATWRMGEDDGLSTEGMIMGTPAYIAPETALGGQDIDARVDLYGLGCVGYWLLTGERVFPARRRNRFQDDSGGYPFRGVDLTVPSFPGVLLQFPDIRLNVEMKDFTIEQARGLCRLLRQFDAVDRVLVSAFAHTPMAAFREACPEVATGATRREATAFYYLHRLRLGRIFRSPATALQLPLSFRGGDVITPGLLEAARESNRTVQVWTVNDEEAMRRLLSLDVQGILTDRPSRLLALMGRARRPP